MTYLTREQILAKHNRKVYDVEVPELETTVRVRGLSALEYDLYQKSMIQVRGKSIQLKLTNSTAKLVALGCVDENGARMFTDEDIAALGELSAAGLGRIAEKIQQLSGITDGDVKTLTANFTTDPLTDSITS